MQQHLADSVETAPTTLCARWWERTLRNGLFAAVVLGAAVPLVAIPFLEVTSVWPFVVAMGVAYGAGLGVTVGFHRYFAHRSFDTSRAFQFVLAAVGCLSLQKAPLWWIATHRLHHRHADRPGDPHSPVRGGFWYAHMGWLFSRNVLLIDYAIVKDLTKYPELVWLNRLWLVPGLVFATLCFLTMGWAGVVIGYCVPVAIMLQATSAVNSVCHLFGARRFETTEQSRNNWLVALLTHGEGWHNNHHAAPYSARHGFAWYEFDLSYQFIRALELLGLVWNVKRPPAELLAGEERESLAVSAEPPGPV